VRRDGFSELVPRPRSGRVFTHERRPGLGDCAPSGRIRLDALARWLQDVAWADVDDAGVADKAVWVVRRTRMSVHRFPRFGERLTVATFCSGFGRMWAERRTTVTPADGSASDVEAVSLWVHLDPLKRRPSPLSAEEVAVYGEAAQDRRVTARLRHPPPRDNGERLKWGFRATECDLAGHINNAAYWEPLEEELLSDEDPNWIDVEIEFRTPSQPGEKVIVRDSDRRWIVSAEGETHASILVARGPSPDGHAA
jgi:acyl-ACP thioesterase